MKRQPWIHSAWLDGLFIFAPAFLVSLVAPFVAGWPVSSLAWILLVLCVDVSHVYGSLYRTYFDPQYLREHGGLLFAIPALCWVVGSLLYFFGLFWSALAYLAVFHFVRQQYGFFRIYSRDEGRDRLGAVLVYLATLYPLAFWHAHLPRGFHWFVEGDFFPGLPSWFASGLGWMYFGVAVAYAIREIRRPFNMPKQLLVLGTALSWYIGIVAFNGDLAFTATNVIAHGVPYFALVWAVGRREDPKKKNLFGITYGQWYSARLIPVYVGVLVLFAFLEEGLWDGLVWHEHTHVFSLFQSLPPVTSATILAALVPLLALPQSTHYVLDGFIWKVRGRKSFL